METATDRHEVDGLAACGICADGRRGLRRSGCAGLACACRESVHLSGGGHALSSSAAVHGIPGFAAASSVLPVTDANGGGVISKCDLSGRSGISGSGFLGDKGPLLRTLLESKRLRVGVMFLVVVTSGFSLYGFGRSDWYHLIPLVLTPLPLIAVLGHLHCAGQARWHGAQRMALIAAAVACLLVLATRTEDYLRAPSSNLEKARGIALPQEGRWVALAVNDLQADSGPLFVAAERHDRILVNALGIYFLSGRALQASILRNSIPE